MDIRLSEGQWKVEIPAGPWALYDTEDNCWLGDDNGPRLFADDDPDDRTGNYFIARVAAQMADVQLVQTPGRIRAIPYVEGPKRWKDSVEVKVDAETALRRLEEGSAL